MPMWNPWRGLPVSTTNVSRIGIFCFEIGKFVFMEVTMKNTDQLIGCCIEGAKTPFCDKLCPVHNCVRRSK